MSTVVVVKKAGLAVIAADTLITFGSIKESAEYIVNHGKIVKYKENYLGVSGSSSLQIALEDFLVRTKKKFSLESTREIYRFGLLFHKELKENHYIRPDDDNDAFETFHGDVLIANSKGIFCLSSYRYVQEFTKFYANGSGSEFALGALFAVYDDEGKSAEDIAKLAVRAGTEFDDGSGLPITCFSVKLK